MKIMVGDFGWQTAKVYVDGVEAKAVVEADEEKGWVRECVHTVTEKGTMVMKPTRDGTAVRVRMRAGSVQVRMDPKVLLQMQMAKVLEP